MTIDAAVRARGGRMTVQRRLILEALERARHHTTAEEITRYVRSRHPHVDASTVYRNLEALERVGAVTHTHIEGRVTRWHLGGVERHGHLVCSSCGREDEVPLRVLEATTRRLRAEYGFEADLAHSAIVGTCRRCATVSSA
jgi:Fur family transcriptional regulator, ferric uptake regulator